MKGLVFIIRTTVDGDNLINKHKKKIGNITYIISSVFDEKAKGDVIDKISRLIEKEVSNISLDDVVNL